MGFHAYCFTSWFVFLGELPEKSFLTVHSIPRQKASFYMKSKLYRINFSCQVTEELCFFSPLSFLISYCLPSKTEKTTCIFIILKGFKIEF